MDVLNAMSVFVAVAETGGITSAAERLGCSKAIVSRTLSLLEDRLNVRLLNRTTRKVSLTEAGQEYLDHCRAMLEQNYEIESRFAASALEPQGRLRVTAPVSFGIRHLGPVLPKFLELNPKVQIDLEMTDSFVDLVENGLDLAIRIGAAGQDSLITRKIGETVHVLAAAPALIKRMGGPPSSEAELRNWPILNYTLRTSPPPWSGARSFTANDRIRSNNGDVLIGMAEAGLGLCYMPRFLADQSIADGKLEIVLPDIATERTPIHVLYPHRRKLALKTRVFIDFLAEHLGPNVT
ncbi:LysR family transcriptional regulator [Cucumibacter marinus]|uniref:LysR family transcriptional regulator n=1 Tax=Cucumibacter marinus TaxID=1121252 RepID=UPI0004259572|nr:LysR family transcriptional regulator [Cucumibacter marinus]